MEVAAVARAEPAGQPAASVVVSNASPWTTALFAHALTYLLRRPVTADEVRERAVALGLLRQLTAELSPRSAARLLLAGYRLPALVESGSPASVRDHLLAGRLVFVVLREGASYRLHRLDGPEALAELATDWAATGNATLVAARSWAELPTEGLLFFGGLREADGAYHWNTAECDTDRQGRILRC